MKLLLLAAVIASLGHLMAAAPPPAVSAPVEIGDRREIFVDRALIATMENATLKLGEPRPEEISMTFDHPWEASTSAAYMTVLKDGGKYRLYYRGGTRTETSAIKAGSEVTCYAESEDGKKWLKPKRGIL